MTALRLALAGLLAACGVVFLTPASSYACSCVSGRPQDFAAWADTVFTGTLTEVTPPPQREVMSSGDPVTYAFEVDAVHEGDVGGTVEVTSAVSGASCGLEGLETGTRYLVFATGDPGRLEAGLCGGTGPVGDELPASYERVLGAGHAPDGSPGSPPGSTAIAALVAGFLALLHWP